MYICRLRRGQLIFIMRIILLFIFCFSLIFQGQAQVEHTKYSSKNYNNWSLGVNLGNTYVTAEASSFENSRVGFEVGFSGYAIKHFTSALGFKLQIGAGDMSGANNEDHTYFEGNYKQLSGLIQINLSNLSMTGKKKKRGVGLYLDIGAGGLMFNSKSWYDDAANTVLHETGIPPGEPTNEWLLTGGLSGKFRLSDKISLEIGSQANILQGDGNDFLDAHFENEFNNHTDMFFYSYMGISVGLGEKRESIEWTNPLDEMAMEVTEISEKIEGMTNDMDNDGVVDAFDEDNYTPEGVFVDTKGRARDIDGDGVPDHLDMDPFTRKGAEVDENGREIDSDGDGVPDSQDLEPNTAPGALVNFQGKSIAVAMGGSTGLAGGAAGNAYLPSIYFETGKHFVTYANYERVAAIAKVLKANPNIRMRVIGHTDQNGTEEANITLGEKRAQAVVDHLIDIYGVDPTQIFAESKGEFELISNKVDEVNRRVDFVIIPPQ